MGPHPATIIPDGTLESDPLIREARARTWSWPTSAYGLGGGRNWENLGDQRRKTQPFYQQKLGIQSFANKKSGESNRQKLGFFNIIRSSMNKNEKYPPHQDQKLVQKPSKTYRFQEPPGPTQHCTTVRGKSGGQSLAHPCTHLAYGSPERTWHILWTCLWWHTRYHCIEGRGMEWNGLLKIQGEEKRMMVRSFNHHFPR